MRKLSKLSGIVRASVFSTPTSKSDGDSPEASMRRRILRALDFDESELSLRRGAPITSVLSGGGTIFRSSKGSADTYDISRPVDFIDYFISHNWSTPRSTKFLALLMHENLAFAMLMSYAVLGCVLVLGLLGALPLDLRWRWSSFYGLALSFVTFYSCFFLGHVVKEFICCKKKNIFLDKICIHQTDAEIQRLGIEKLGAYINASREMVVVLADTYFKKLWTVYEIATYMIITTRLQKRASINMVTTRHPWMLLICQPFVFASVLIAIPSLHLTWPTESDAPLPDIDVGVYVRRWLIQWPFHIIFSYFVKVLVKQQSQNMRNLQNFSVHNANCFVESDRALVNKNIASFMEHAGLVPVGRTRTDSGQDMSLNAFDCLVRNNCPKILAASTGRQTVSYVYCSAVSIAFAALVVDMIVDRYARGVSGGYIIALFVYYGFLDRVSLALFMFTLSFVWQKADGVVTGFWAEGVCLVLSAGAAGFVFNAPLMGLHKLLYMTVERTSLAGIAVAFYVLIFASITIFVFRPVTSSVPPLSELAGSATDDGDGSDGDGSDADNGDSPSSPQAAGDQISQAAGDEIQM